MLATQRKLHFLYQYAWDELLIKIDKFFVVIVLGLFFFGFVFASNKLMTQCQEINKLVHVESQIVFCAIKHLH